MADDLGYADIGAFGSELISTPNIDRLAQEGARYTQFYAGGPVCAPSRDVLMTGRHMGHATFRSNTPKIGGEEEAFGDGTRRIFLPGNETTIAAILRDAGYVTGITGKWGIGEPDSGATPTEMGFDAWLGYLNQNHANYYYPDYLWSNDTRLTITENEGAYDYHFLSSFALDLIDSHDAREPEYDTRIYSNDLMRDFSLEFIREHRDSPFFLYMAVTIPHKLMEVPSLGEYADKDWPRDAKIYAAMVTRLDGYVGDIVDELERQDIAGNTLVIFTSDNGPVADDTSTFLGSAGSLRGAKGTLYEGGLRVPLVLKWPGVVPAGSVNSTPWMFVDIFPTFAELAGASHDGDLDGISMLPSILGQRQDVPDRLLYWEFPRTRLWQAGRLGGWKAVREGMDQPVELYDLETDPGEAVNVADSHPHIVSRISRLLTEAHRPSPYWPQK